MSTSTRKKVFAEYGISYRRHAAYEVDHLIPLELGGNNSLANLWPEKGKRPNAKDGLENKLHDLVCQHKMSTRKAQRVIARNWVTALATYGHTGYVYDWPTAAAKHGGGSHSCTTTSSGSCIRGGEFCPSSKAGQFGWDAQGHKYICRDGHWRVP